ncbi:unnamed protein product, partial [Oppiella nova]
EVRRIKIETKRQKRKYNDDSNSYIDSSSNLSPEQSNSGHNYAHKDINSINTNTCSPPDVKNTITNDDSGNGSNISNLHGMEVEVLSPHISHISTDDNNTDAVVSDNLSVVPVGRSITDSDTNSRGMEVEVFEPKSSEDDINNLIKFDDWPVVPIGRPITDYNNGFNEKEYNSLNELLAATSHLQRNFIPFVTSEPTVSEECARILFTKCEKDIPKLVKMCKSLRGFNTVCDSDQISLLKLGGLEMILLRSIITYDSLTDSWIVFEDNTKSARVSLKLWRWTKPEPGISNHGFYHMHHKYISNMMDIWDGDPLTLDLLTLILLFNPNRPNLTHRDTVKLQRQMYIHLLQRYLHLKYRSECEAKLRLMRLMSSFEDIHELGICHANAFMDWILNDEEREVRRIKIETKRQKRKYNDDSNSYIDSSSDSSPEPSNSGHNYAHKDINNIDTNTCSPPDVEKTTNFDVFNESDSRGMEVLSPHINDISDDDISDLIEFDNWPVVPVGRPITDYNNNFNENEFSRLNELLAATSHLQRNFIPFVTSEPTEFYDCVHTILNKCEKDIPNMVKMCKSLRGFNTVCDSDQISLLKLGGLEMIMLRSIVTYDGLTDSWIVYEDDNKSSRVSLNMWIKDPDPTISVGLYEEHKKYITNMMDLWDGDPLILDLLSAILLFNPNRPNLAHKETVKLQRHIYMHLLQRYLQLKYRSECEAKTRLMRLMSNFADIQRLSVRHANSFMIKQAPQADPPLPLLKEICDTKPSYELMVL